MLSNAIPEDWARTAEWVERALDQHFSQPETLLVLHDLMTGAMDKLDRFLALAEERGVRFLQEFPARCVPIERGKVLWPVDAYMSETGGTLA